jgi:hypothetical protein
MLDKAFSLWDESLARAPENKSVTLFKFLQKIEDKLIFIKNTTSNKRGREEAWFKISE